MALNKIVGGSALALACLASLVSADVRTYDFTAEWMTANPDGLYERRVMGINGQWPIPTIFATVGDQVVVNLHNNLGAEPCSLHFHGLFMNGTSHMDGVAQTTQCPIPPNSTFTYAFNVTQPGTYWYHSHVDGQYPDGLRGPLIVHDPENPYADQFDEELVLTLSDWYHDEMPGLIKSFLSVTNPTGAEPVPQSALMNDTQNLQVAVEPGKTYFIRIINMAGFAAQYFWVEGHSFKIIEVDGVWHEPAEAEMIYVTAAQRYGILLTTHNDTTANFPIVGSMDTDLFDKIPDGLNPNVTSYLVYDKSLDMPKPADVDSFDATFDDVTLVPTDREPLWENPVESYSIEVLMDNLGDGANYAFFNGITFVRPKVPTLYTVLSAPNASVANSAEIYGVNTHPFILAHNDVYEIVLNNHDPGKHPFHLHGHNFQVLTRGAEESGDWSDEAVRNGSVTFPQYPMRRDTLLVRPNGHFVIRFRSDNPGVWLFHCHIEWHVDSGLILTIVEAPAELQQQLQGKIPQDHFDSCKAQGMPFEGNAAANTVDWYDIKGANVSPAPLPAGFTPRGIVALTFSIVAGLLGCAIIIWYGLGEMPNIEQQRLGSKLAGGVVGVDGQSEGASDHAVDAVKGVQATTQAIR